MSGKRGLLFAIIIAICFSMIGCGPTGPSDEEIIRDMLNSDDFDLVAECADEMVSAVTRDADMAMAFSQAGIDPSEFSDAFCSRMSAEFGDIKVDGDKATVPFTLTMPSGEVMDSYFETYLEKYVKDIDVNGLDQDGIYKVVIEAMIAMFSEEDLPITTNTYEMQFEKQGGEWIFTNDDEITAQIDNDF